LDECRDQLREIMVARGVGLEGAIEVLEKTYDGQVLCLAAQGEFMKVSGRLPAPGFHHAFVRYLADA
jgi:hypothetical protein